MEIFITLRGEIHNSVQIVFVQITKEYGSR